MAPPLDLSNSPRLANLIRDGKLYISLHDAIALAIENNLDLAYFRYNFPIAQTDLQRTKAGSPANGVNTGDRPVHPGRLWIASSGGGSHWLRALLPAPAASSRRPSAREPQSVPSIPT